MKLTYNYSSKNNEQILPILLEALAKGQTRSAVVAECRRRDLRGKSGGQVLAALTDAGIEQYQLSGRTKANERRRARAAKATKTLVVAKTAGAKVTAAHAAPKAAKVTSIVSITKARSARKEVAPVVAPVVTGGTAQDAFDQAFAAAPDHPQWYGKVAFGQVRHHDATVADAVAYSMKVTPVKIAAWQASKAAEAAAAAS